MTTGQYVMLSDTSPTWGSDPTNQHRDGDMNTLEELFQAMKSRDPNLPAWHSLPTFGGREPDDTEGVWSWDAERLLIGTCAEDLEIIPR